MTTILTIGLLLLVACNCALLVIYFRADGKRRKLAQQLRQSKGQQDLSDRHLALARLAGAVAHDLNNQLTVITGYAEELAASVDQDDQRSDARTILDSSLQAAELSRRLLAFSRPDQQLTLPINLNIILGSMHKLLEDVAGEDIILEMLPAPELPAINADPATIERILVELVSFCRNRTPPNGRIVLRTELMEVHPDGGLFDDHGVAVGRHVALQIRDLGPLPEAVDQLFSTTGNDATAALARAVSDFGGRVFAESATNNRGLSVRLLFPAIASSTVEAPAPTAIPRGSGTVLIAEDSDQMRSFVHRALANLGYDVFSARGSEEAVFLFRRHAEAIDLLIADVMMPIETGAELYNRLRAINPQLPVLFISGYSADSLEDQHLLPDGAPLLTKPFTIESLARQVQARIRKRS